MLGWLQDKLLEPNNGGASLSTTQFTLAQLENSLNQAQWDFVRDTGLITWHAGFNGDSNTGIEVTPNTEQVALPQDCMDVRRLAWIAYNTANPSQVTAVTELPRQDSFALDGNVPGWENDIGTPYTADESLPPVPSVNVSNQPSDIGALDVLYTPVPTQLSNTGVPFSVPPDFAYAVGYRALQILFSLQGDGADDQRAKYAGDRYALYVQLTKAFQFLGNTVPIQGAG